MWVICYRSCLLRENRSEYCFLTSNFFFKGDALNSVAEICGCSRRENQAAGDTKPGRLLPPSEWPDRNPLTCSLYHPWLQEVDRLLLELISLLIKINPRVSFLFLFHLLSEAQFIPVNRADENTFGLSTRVASSLSPDIAAKHLNHN